MPGRWLGSSSSRIPKSQECQWANFVRNHDELTLDQLTENQGQGRDMFGPDEDMQLFGRGLRRRLPSMLDGNPERMRMTYSLLLSLPGSPCSSTARKSGWERESVFRRGAASGHPCSGPRRGTAGSQASTAPD